MKIAVLVKQVPDTNEVRIHPETGTLIRDGVPSILNPDDAIALEAALTLRGVHGGSVTALTMGPPQAGVMLRECMAMGADEAVLLCDRAFAGSDTWATANALAAAVRRLGGVDLILAGQQAIDGDTAQVGPQVAERLGVPQVTYAQALSVHCGVLRATRKTDSGSEVLSAPLPALVTAVRGLGVPRHMPVLGVLRAYKKEISVWTLADLDITAEQTGLKASPTRVLRSFTPEPRGTGVLHEGTPRELAKTLAAILKPALT